MALVVLDASVVIAQLDLDDALHDVVQAALDARAGDDLRLPLTAYSESLVGPAAGGRLETASDDIDRLGVAVEPLDVATAKRAATLRASRPSLRLPDALIIACAYELGADEILTADRRWAGLDRVTVLG